MCSLRESSKRLLVDTPLETAARKIHAAVKRLFFTANCYPLARERLAGKYGLEIGGPSYIFDTSLPVYRHVQALDNCVFAEVTHWEGTRTAGATFRFDSGKRTGTNFITEGATLDGMDDAKYDFVLSSHNLEHLANPVKALQNWKRVMTPGGFLLLVLPDKHRTFDHRRPVTALDHLFDDYTRDVGEDDMTHVEEFVTLRDYSRRPIPNSMERACYRDNYHYRLVHHHVFDLPSAVKLLDSCEFKVLSAERLRPNHLIFFAQSP